MRGQRIKSAGAQLFEGAENAGRLLADTTSRAIGIADGWIRQRLIRLKQWSAPVRDRVEAVVDLVTVKIRPLTRPLRAILARIAPLVARLVLLVAAVIGWVLSSIASTIEWTRDAVIERLIPAAGRGAGLASAAIDPVRTGAFSCLVAAGLLIGSQFLDYRGVAVGAPLYQGQIAVDAPAPVTATAVTGSAHFWLLIPVAIGAGILAVGILRGGGRNLAIAIAALGLITVAVALVVDLPKALDPVNALPYSDATTRLLGGFWAQLSAGIALVVSGAVLFRGSQGGPSRRRVKPAPRAVDLAPAGGN
ncbi:MAG: hypothetical protein ACKOPI_02535 [bacterium]